MLVYEEGAQEGVNCHGPAVSGGAFRLARMSRRVNG